MKSFALLIFLFQSLLTFLNARNDESAGQTGNPFQKDEVDKRIDKAIAFIISKQKKDGSIYDRGNHTTMTSLALMAMAAVGHQPVNPNDEGEAMQRALDFVLQEDRQSETGYYGSKDGSRMYGHGITTLTLSEMLGMGLDFGRFSMLVYMGIPALIGFAVSAVLFKTNKKLAAIAGLLGMMPIFYFIFMFIALAFGLVPK